MENRKIIVASYITAAMLGWFLTRSALQFLYVTFYQVRRLSGIATINEVLPVVVAALTFGILLKHPRVSTVLDEVVSELKKMSWPSREDVIKSTTVVLICVLFASFVLAGFDLAWGEIIGYLLHS